VLEHYDKEKFDFLMKAFNNPTYLEDLTGLTKMKEEADNIEWEVAQDDDFEV
jgi:ubiquitin-like modifier-activating enzyme ATG7